MGKQKEQIGKQIHEVDKFFEKLFVLFLGLSFLL